MNDNPISHYINGTKLYTEAYVKGLEEKLAEVEVDYMAMRDEFMLNNTQTTHRDYLKINELEEKNKILIEALELISEIHHKGDIRIAHLIAKDTLVKIRGKK